MAGAQPRSGATIRSPGASLAVALIAALMAVVVPASNAVVEADGVATGLVVTTTTVTGDINPSLTGQTVTFTATVAGDSITNYTDPSISGPVGIAVGPDGALWFTNYNNDSIGRITTAGVVTNYTAAGIDAPLAIVAGPDGNLWFTSYLNDAIGKISTSGAVTLYTDALLITRPQVIAVGPDGALWFADGGILNQRTIGRITTGGVVTSFSDGPPGCDALTNICEPVGIAAGSDGALWYTNSGSFPVLGGSIGRITTAGVRTSYTSTGVSTPLYIAAGPDSALWFTNVGDNSIGRITTAGTITNYTSGTISGPRDIAAGSDGNLWFANYGGDSIGRISPAGVVTSYAAASVDGPYGIVSGPDGALWFTNFDGNSIGRISPAAPLGGTPTGTVQFKVDGTNVGSPVSLDGAGQAQISTSALAAGGHVITAIYSGDAKFNTSASPNFTQTVNNKAATTTVVTSNANPSVYAWPVTFTASVGEVVPDTVSLTGTVEFKDGGTTITGCGTAPLNASGQATCGPLTDLSVGNHTVTATYSGDPSFGASASADLTQTVTDSPAVDTTPPHTGPVQVELLVGGHVNNGPLQLSWSATDDVTAASDLVHRVQVRRIKHGVLGRWIDVAGVTGTQLESVRPLWRHFQYRVQTRDEAGNWGAWEESNAIVLLRRDDRHFRQSSGWTTLPMAGAMRGDVAESSTAGDWARLRFYGSGVALIMPAGAGVGSMEVCIDPGTAGKECVTVDMSTLALSGQRRLVAVFNGLPLGLHHLRVTVTSGTIDLDGALVSL